MRIWNRSFVLLLSVNTLIFLSFNMATAGFPAFVTYIGSSHLTTGLVTSVAAIAGLLMRPIAGYGLDYRNEKVFFTIGLLCLAAPLLCLFFSSAETVLIVRFIQGVGWGIASTACSKLIANSLPKNRISEGIGYAGLFSSVAAAFAPSIAVFISESLSFNSMFIIVGTCPILAVIIFLLNDRKNCVKSETKTKRSYSWTKISPKLLYSALLIMTITFAYAPMITFVIPFAQTFGAGSAGFFFAYACTTIVARPLTGLYVDRKNANIPTIIALISIVIASVLLYLYQTPLCLVLSGALAGIGTGAGMNALQTLSINCVSKTKRGTAMAVFLFGFDLGMAGGSLIAGVLVGIIGFNYMFFIMASPALIAFLIVVTKMVIECLQSKKA